MLLYSRDKTTSLCLFSLYRNCIPKATQHTFMMMMNQFTSKRKIFWDAAKQSQYVSHIRSPSMPSIITCKYHRVCLCFLALIRVLHFSNIYSYIIYLIFFFLAFHFSTLESTLDFLCASYFILLFKSCLNMKYMQYHNVDDDSMCTARACAARFRLL